jgi:hypothetical protein
MTEIVKVQRPVNQPNDNVCLLYAEGRKKLTTTPLTRLPFWARNELAHTPKIYCHGQFTRAEGGRWDLKSLAATQDW